MALTPAENTAVNVLIGAIVAWKGYTLPVAGALSAAGELTGQGLARINPHWFPNPSDRQYSPLQFLLNVGASVAGWYLGSSMMDSPPKVLPKMPVSTTPPGSP